MYICVKKSCHTEVVLHMCRWILSNMWMSHDTHVNASCHTYEWVVSRTRMSHVTYMNDYVTHVNESCHIYEWVMSHVWMSHVTRMNVCVNELLFEQTNSSLVGYRSLLIEYWALVAECVRRTQQLLFEQCWTMCASHTLCHKSPIPNTK